MWHVIARMYTVYIHVERWLEKATLGGVFSSRSTAPSPRFNKCPSPVPTEAAHTPHNFRGARPALLTDLHMPGPDFSRTIDIVVTRSRIVSVSSHSLGAGGT